MADEKQREYGNKDSPLDPKYQREAGLAEQSRNVCTQIDVHWNEIAALIGRVAKVESDVEFQRGWLRSCTEDATRLTERVARLEDRLQGHWEEMRHLDTLVREQSGRLTKVEARPGLLDAAKAHTNEVARAALATAEARFDSVNARLNSVVHDIDSLEKWQALHAARMEKLESGQTILSDLVSRLQDHRLVHATQLDKLFERLTAAEEAISTELASQEMVHHVEEELRGRIDALEQKAAPERAEECMPKPGGPTGPEYFRGIGRNGDGSPIDPAPQEPVEVQVGQVWRFKDGSGDVQVVPCTQVHTDGGRYYPDELREHATLVSSPAPAADEDETDHAALALPVVGRAKLVITEMHGKTAPADGTDPEHERIVDELMAERQGRVAAPAAGGESAGPGTGKTWYLRTSDDELCDRCMRPWRDHEVGEYRALQTTVVCPLIISGLPDDPSPAPLLVLEELVGAANAVLSGLGESWESRERPGSPYFDLRLVLAKAEKLAKMEVPSEEALGRAAEELGYGAAAEYEEGEPPSQAYTDLHDVAAFLRAIAEVMP